MSADIESDPPDRGALPRWSVGPGACRLSGSFHPAQRRNGRLRAERIRWSSEHGATRPRHGGIGTLTHRADRAIAVGIVAARWHYGSTRATDDGQPSDGREFPWV